MYLHAIANRGFGNVIWTGIWTSTDNGATWAEMGAQATFPASLHNGYAQLWSWDFNPADGWVYIISTGFQRDKGGSFCAAYVRPISVTCRSTRVGAGPITSGPGTTHRPRSLRRNLGRVDVTKAGHRQMDWRLPRVEYALGYRTIDSPTADL